MARLKHPELRVQPGEQRLLLSETNEDLDPLPLLSFGLTKREAEVLLWVSQGKRNGEIATILGTAPKTITKHLQRIFQKLGVETRTSAANIALGVLHPSALGKGSPRPSASIRVGYGVSALAATAANPRNR